MSKTHPIIEETLQHIRDREAALKSRIGVVQEEIDTLLAHLRRLGVKL